MKPTDALLSSVMNYRGLRFQWLLVFNDDGSIDCQHRIGIGELAGEWQTTTPTVARDTIEDEPGIFPDLPVSAGCAEVDGLLQRHTVAYLTQRPIAGWRPVEWFKVESPSGVPLEVIEKFQDLTYFG